MKKSFIFPLVALILTIICFASCETTVPDDNQNVREQYVAPWNCTEQSGMSYPVTITLDANNSTQVLIGNFHYLGTNEKAYAIATTNNLTIPSQEICSNTINGGGTLNNANKITMKYYVNNHSTIDTVNATYTK